jgi:hypothetical protein
MQISEALKLHLYKNRGNWIQGFVNYTYMVSTSGRFGFGTYYENPAEQRDYERRTTSIYQSRPVPRPYGRLNVDLLTPSDFGPDLSGFKPLANWKLNLYGTWRNGFYFTWTGGGVIPGVEYNVQWKDIYNVDLRFGKTFELGKLNLQLFMDVFNIFNFKYMDNVVGFSDSKDYESYMKSLQLPYESFGDFPNKVAGYANARTAEGKGIYIYGSDRPGDVRKGPYIPWDDSAPESTKAEWRANKSYIDMPNQDYFTFLNPRNFYFGIRVGWEIF